MPENKTKLLVVLAVVVALCATAVVVAFPGRGQSPSGAEKPAAKTETTEIERPATKLTAATKPSAPNAAAATAVTGAPVSPAFATAVAQNLSLKYGLNWTFGGKQQRGWHLYTPLIGRLLETESDAGTPEFASALAGWQKGAGLAPSGVLDNDTWFRMFSTWQSRRLKNRGYAQPDHLLTAPASEFYDPSRPAELRQVDVEAYAAYKRMIAVAAADSSLGLAVTADGELAPSEKYLKIISSFRSKEYQEHLRRQSPNAGRAGLAVNSPHFTGCALDIYVGGEPVETKDANRAIQVQTPVYKWLVKNAERFGFHPYYYEPWHWEYRAQ